MKKFDPVSRKAAIKTIDQLFETHFGSEKGSTEAYVDFMEQRGFCEFTDEGGVDKEPPCQYEFLLALGVTPQELVDVLGINHKIFTKDFCDMYNAKKPVGSKQVNCNE
jgi:hypothetical protein